MKYDRFSSLIREKYEPEFHLGNLGDACAETCRAKILGSRDGSWAPFILPNSDGYLRHPLLATEGKGWDERDFSNDQFITLAMAMKLENSPWFSQLREDNRVFIRGTWTLLSIGSWCILRGQWALLEKANQLQGWLLTKKYRWSDEKKWFDKVEGKVQDYLNMIIIHVFLLKMGKPSVLPRPVEECMNAIRAYYLDGEDFEPNSAWIVDLYSRQISTASPTH